MDPAGEFLLQERVDLPVPLDAALAGEGDADHPNPEMRLAGAVEGLVMRASGVVMPGMEVAFVDDLEPLGRECLTQLFLDPRPCRHLVTLAVHSRRPRTLPEACPASPQALLFRLFPICQFLFGPGAGTIIGMLMKLDSEYFDAIRVKGKRTTSKPKPQECAWEGCREPGVHKAPLGRDFEGQYVHFCVDHVRQYNKSYNYFSGLDDTDIQRYLKDSLTGNRPTWKMGQSAAPGDAAQASAAFRARRWNGRVRDPFNLFAGEEARRRAPAQRPKVRSLEVKAFETLDLSSEASGEAIRARYKNLVKQLHPDANGGDRGTEDRLRDVIQAYKLLKQSGFC